MHIDSEDDVQKMPLFMQRNIFLFWAQIYTISLVGLDNDTTSVEVEISCATEMRKDRRQVESVCLSETGI